MPNDIDWVATCITEACSSIVVPIAVSDKLKELLGGKLSEQQLSAANLTDTATILILAMVPADCDRMEQE